MKRFISMMIATVVLLSLCVTAANAATSANPIINVYSEKFDGTGATAYYNPTGYDVYKVTYTTEGIDMEEDTITYLAINATVDDSSKVAAKSWVKTKTTGKTADREQNGFLSYGVEPDTVGTGKYVWTKTDGIDVFDWDNYTDPTEETLPYVETLIYVTAGESVTLTYNTAFKGADPTSQIIVDRAGAEVKYDTALQYKINGVVGNTLTLGESAPATVDVTSVTISGATAATVGDNVQLSATVAPDNATDKTVTWSKVSGNGAVSDSGVVTATEAGDVVVKATAGGVDSANYTVSFAAPAPTPVYTDSSIDVKKPTSGTTGLTDLQGKDVTLTANYGIAKFSKDIDIVANKYFVVATDSNDVEQEFEVDFAAKGVEISNVSTTFFAIVKSADHIIKSIRLKEIAR